MQCVYVLQSEKDKECYIGCTHDLKKRFALHNAKKVASTAKRIPFKLIYYEAYIDPKDAFNREIFMKSRWGHNYLRKALSNFFNR